VTENNTEAPPTWGVEFCDKCGHRAHYLAYQPNDELILTFCGHHGQALQLALLGAGWEVDVLDGE
jgi:hypothetical protein